MAQIDIKECEIRVFDGTPSVLVMDCTAVKSDITYTAKIKHIGSDRISIRYINPAAPNQSLSIQVLGRMITVNLATDGSSVITTTAALAKAAIEANSDANALVSMTLDDDGSGLLNAEAEQFLAGQKSISIKVGEGNLTYSEHRNVEFTRDRGRLDTVREADEEPVDLSIDATWEWIRSVTGGIATLEDVLKKVGEASAWVSTADDPCQPYCVDIELWNAPGCGSIEDELIMFEEYYYETVDHDLREGTLATAGRCNRTVAIPRRVLNSEIG